MLCYHPRPQGLLPKVKAAGLDVNKAITPGDEVYFLQY